MVANSSGPLLMVVADAAKHPPSSSREASPPRKKKKFTSSDPEEDEDSSSVASTADDVQDLAREDRMGKGSPFLVDLSKIEHPPLHFPPRRKTKLCTFRWGGETLAEGKYDNQKHEVACMKRGDDHSLISITTPTTISSTAYEDNNNTSGIYGEGDADQDCSEAHRNWEADFQCVSFTTKPPEVIEVASREDFSSEEITSAWYTRDEKQDMQEEAYDMMELDAFTSERSDQRKLHRVRVLVSVLREQRRQRSCGELVINGDELLHAVCYPVSSTCQQLARIQGQRDEIEAKRSLQNDQQGGTKDTSPDLLLKLTRMLRDIHVK